MRNTILNLNCDIYQYFDFLVGNAAFHSSKLYQQLSPCIPHLLTAIEDGDEKTRANAAGAVGNLLKNDESLASLMSRAGMAEALMKMALVDTDAGARVANIYSASPKSL